MTTEEIIAEESSRPKIDDDDGMTVSELIEKLRTMPPDAKVNYIYDSFCVCPVQHLWISSDGIIMASDWERKQAVTEGHRDRDFFPTSAVLSRS